ncbi:MAG: CopG family transcriptional regulator [Clostridium sp.]|uniref:CopG family transcriptional regulator n=1 Tax=Clostridium sp. TaxID=1506 RepID=UPI002FCC9F5D
MKKRKKLLNLPKGLLEEFNNAHLSKSNKDKSEVIRKTVVYYINERKKTGLKELMQKGYQEMGDINCEISECGIASDCLELAKYEAGLAECDRDNGTGGEKRRYILC